MSDSGYYFGACPDCKSMIDHGHAENNDLGSKAQRANVCWTAVHNKILDNNNGATPTSDGAPGLVGTGMTIAGGRHDIVAGNTFSGTTPA